MVVTVWAFTACPASQSTVHLDHLPYSITGSGWGLHSRFSSLVSLRFSVCVLVCESPSTHLPCLELQTEPIAVIVRVLVALSAAHSIFHADHLPSTTFAGGGLQSFEAF